MASEYENLDSGTLFQQESNLRRRYNEVKYGDEGEQENARIKRELKTIQREWERRSDD